MFCEALRENPEVFLDIYEGYLYRLVLTKKITVKSERVEQNKKETRVEKWC